MRTYRLIAMFLGLIAAVVLTSCVKPYDRNSDRVSNPIQKNAPDLLFRNDSIYDAALNGDFARVSELLGRGLDVNQPDQENRTALMYAAYNGHTETVRILLENKAIIDLRDINGRTALMFAASGPYQETLRLLLDHQADPNITDSQEHFTALMYAASEGHLENVKTLLERKADPSIKDIDGDTALDFALKNGHPKVAAWLKEQ